MARSRWAPGAPALAGAARVVEAVLARGQSAEAALAAYEAAPERAAVHAIALGTLRWYLRLAPALESLLPRPARLAGPVRALLAVGAHQIEYSRNAPELTVHAAVDAARMLGAPRAAGLVNAVLRRFAVERAALLAKGDADPAVRNAHPAWLAERILAAWPAQGEAILAANNAHPPMTLRVDLTRTSAAEYAANLVSHSIGSQLIQWMPSALTLDRPTSVSDLPGFSDGVVSVQDAGAQLAAVLVDAHSGMRVLDACAAPGGKSAHLLERAAGALDLTALDVDAGRLERIRENLRRQKRTARLVVADAREPERFWDGKPFDRILVDAPCSASGVIRRHPDIKLLRRAGDVAAFSALQLTILRSAVRMLAPGGRLVYSTCSLLPEENQAVIGRLLAAEPAMAVAGAPPGSAPGALDCAPGLQLLPGSEAGTDGFYYACLEKTTAGS